MTVPAAGMPFTGIATFARAPLAGAPFTAPAAAPPDRPMTAAPPPAAPDPAGAGFAVYGIPFDCAMGYRTGQRLAPRAIRDMSTRLSLPWGPDNPGYWDVAEDRWYLKGARLVDAGDADPLYFDTDHLDASVAELVGRILAAGAVPVALGGDHSVTFPAIGALAPLFAPGGPLHGEKLHIVQLDAHLDYTNAIQGFARSNSSPIRRATELDFVGEVTVIGIRGIRTNPEAYQAAVDRGNRVVLMRTVREHGLAAALGALPAGAPVYLTLDVDGLEPAAAPGTSSPEPGGLTYDEVRAILQATAARNRVIALDVVEVNPYLDVAGMTSLVAARLMVEAMACVHAAATGG